MALKCTNSKCRKGTCTAPLFCKCGSPFCTDACFISSWHAEHQRNCPNAADIKAEMGLGATGADGRKRKGSAHLVYCALSRSTPQKTTEDRSTPQKATTEDTSLVEVSTTANSPQSQLSSGTLSSGSSGIDAARVGVSIQGGPAEVAPVERRVSAEMDRSVLFNEPPLDCTRVGVSIPGEPVNVVSAEGQVSSEVSKGFSIDASRVGVSIQGGPADTVSATGQASSENKRAWMNELDSTRVEVSIPTGVSTSSPPKQLAESAPRSRCASLQESAPSAVPDHDVSPVYGLAEAQASATSAETGPASVPTKKYSLDDFQDVGAAPLGTGSYGSVRKVMHKPTGDVFAMKVIAKQRIVEHNMQDHLAREVQVQLKAKHPNIIKMQYYLEDDRAVYLILEYAEKGHLFSHLRRIGAMKEADAGPIFSDVAQALLYLHERGVVHRDLKPENILLCADGKAKLADFGWCVELTQVEEQRHTFCGTMDYLTPEMVNNEPHTMAVDSWALGVLLYEMLVARPPFAAPSQKDLVDRIGAVDLHVPDRLSLEAQSLIKALIVKEPRKRLTMAQILEHPWVRKHSPKAISGSVSNSGLNEVVVTPKKAPIQSALSTITAPVGSALTSALLPVASPSLSPAAPTKPGDAQPAVGREPSDEIARIEQPKSLRSSPVQQIGLMKSQSCQQVGVGSNVHSDIKESPGMERGRSNEACDISVKGGTSNPTGKRSSSPFAGTNALHPVGHWPPPNRNSSKEARLPLVPLANSTVPSGNADIPPSNNTQGFPTWAQNTSNSSIQKMPAWTQDISAVLATAKATAPAHSNSNDEISPLVRKVDQETLPTASKTRPADQNPFGMQPSNKTPMDTTMKVPTSDAGSAAMKPPTSPKLPVSPDSKVGTSVPETSSACADGHDASEVEDLKMRLARVEEELARTKREMKSSASLPTLQTVDMLSTPGKENPAEKLAGIQIELVDANGEPVEMTPTKNMGSASSNCSPDVQSIKNGNEVSRMARTPEVGYSTPDRFGIAMSWAGSNTFNKVKNFVRKDLESPDVEKDRSTMLADLERTVKDLNQTTVLGLQNRTLITGGAASSSASKSQPPSGSVKPGQTGDSSEYSTAHLAAHAAAVSAKIRRRIQSDITDSTSNNLPQNVSDRGGASSQPLPKALMPSLKEEPLRLTHITALSGAIAEARGKIFDDLNQSIASVNAVGQTMPQQQAYQKTSPKHEVIPEESWPELWESEGRESKIFDAEEIRTRIGSELKKVSTALDRQSPKHGAEAELASLLNSSKAPSTTACESGSEDGDWVPTHINESRRGGAQSRSMGNVAPETVDDEELLSNVGDSQKIGLQDLDRSVFLRPLNK